MSIATAGGSTRAPKRRVSKEKRAMPDPIEDLRSTEESILEDAETVLAMEREKSELDPKDPRVGELSDRIKDKTTELDAKATAEQDLSEEVQKEA
jgi:hypothetical protein